MESERLALERVQLTANDDAKIYNKSDGNFPTP